MDSISAKRLAERFIDRQVNGWNVHSFINNGKSAIVCHAEKDGVQAALKIFDPELIERFGDKTQAERIKRETLLIGENHPNLVKIFEGGFCEEFKIFYIVMEFLPGKSLSSAIEIIPNEHIAKIIRQISSAAKHLEDLGLTHRDIKPDNINIDENFDAILLDLGVIRPIEGSALTDNNDIRPFIGTLRYSPPEFLLRAEEQTLDGWRAVTFYQIAAVLHDLIMKKPIFLDHSEPYAKLVFAVRYEEPLIVNDGLPKNIIHLARNGLVKDPKIRLRLVGWEDYINFKEMEDDIESIRSRIEKRIISNTFSQQQVTINFRENFLKQKKRELLVTDLSSMIRNLIITSQLFPPFETSINHDENDNFDFLIFSFNNSSNLSLSAKIFVVLKLEILDLDSKAICISCTAFLAKSKNIDNFINSNSFTEIFEGVFDKSILQSKLSFLFFDILENAIDSSPEYLSENNAGDAEDFKNLI